MTKRLLKMGLLGLGAGASFIVGNKFRRYGHVSIDASDPIVPSDKMIPTLFIHGYGGNRLSFGPMISRFERDGYGRKDMVIIVDIDGSLHVEGQLRSAQPFIQILFKNDIASVEKQSAWLYHIMQFLFGAYGIKQVDFVGHSMGGVSILRYLTECRDALDAPVVAHAISIGAPYNDHNVAQTTPQIEDLLLTDAGPIETTPLYRYFEKTMRHLPKNLQFLNIAGDLKDGNDGAVSVNSALSLRYLVQNQLNYHELIVSGRKAAHRLLHENQRVDDSIYTFLWKKHK
ncbi:MULTISPECIES: alpha/beta hydrolase [Dellaglioa]|nr:MULTISPECIES: alpha/beta hydrolase [Dellaglioa]MCZ2491772.1 alpha/beta hydrolase [Dellaglioa carnosa]MCZ2493327.1 alpha/beta hydrolase [Dellaglioa carnosa]MCZ2494828.1 alpha/beta hydrolase [Dellaglioa carnosa]MDK1718676.1 alpha/beta hydrolase [Dellaglioa algida]MDK1727021.1 alpha/beta hydrolase [Dellaglioa algida]